MRDGPRATATRVLLVTLVGLLLIGLVGVEARHLVFQAANASRPTPKASTSHAPYESAKPTPVPTAIPTATPTPTPSAPGAIWHPRPGTSWQWQLSGTVDTSFTVTMYDIDLYNALPASSYTVSGFGTVNVPQGQNAGIISTLHSQGRVVICYIDTGAVEDYRPDASLFPPGILGAVDSHWPNERWLDIRPSSWPKWEPIMTARFDLAQRAGCDGVEGDQNNSAYNNPGFPITVADEKAWYLEVARLTHIRGMSAAMKNGLEVTDADTVAAFDFNLNEECNQFNECAPLSRFVAANKAVFNVEYTSAGMNVEQFCPQDRAAHFDGLLKNLELDAWRQAC